MPRLSKIGAAALAAFGWTSGASAVTASYLVVAGGGGGGNAVAGADNGGGGGAGGYQTGTTSLNPTLSYTILVGAGGVATTQGNSSQLGALTASVGGGYGGTRSISAGGSGGSGGGGNGTTGTAGGAGTAGQGNAGGTGSGSWGAGGGGAGAVGGNASTGGPAGSGGVGLASSITGTSTFYAGGGGGSGGSTTYPNGGNGGGGTGNGSNLAGGAGTANLGGGGGGGSGSGGSSPAGGAGGSGVVIISYAGAQQFSGGIVTSVGGNTIHTFTTSGTLGPITTLSASYLIVAGGGGGGTGGLNNYNGGAGGAGGLLSGSGLTIDPNSTYLVTVGAGGATNVAGSNSAFNAYTSIGGGQGATGSQGATGGNGGSGGGGASHTGGGSNNGTGTSGQGNNGGSGSSSGAGGVYGSGGGGGASAVGSNGTSSSGGNGGAGTTSSISGSSVTYAGGGGGSASSGSAGTGGAGGGGNGGVAAVGSAGTANLGGGGGAGSGLGASYAGGAGGSGVVIISYAGSTQQMAGGTVTIVGGNVIHTFTSTGYLSPIKYSTGSLRFRSSNSAYLSRTPTVSGNQQKFTFSYWVKRGTLSAQQVMFGINSASNEIFTLTFLAGDTFRVFGRNGGTDVLNLTTTAVYRDPAAWYHIVVAIDTTQATSSNRALLYINGVQVTAFGTATYPAQNTSLAWDSSSYAHNIGRESTGNYIDGEMTEINFIDGQALTPNSFGTFNSYGVWQPITYGGSYGMNGFYLPFNRQAVSYAGSFNGSNQRLTTPAMTSLTGNFTVEFYCNNTGFGSGDSTVFSTYPVNTTASETLIIQRQTSGNWGVYCGALSGSGNLTWTPTITSQGSWVHVALVRSGTTVTAYYNGVAVSTATVSTTITLPSGTSIGAYTNSSQLFLGYISNLRITNTAVYTSNFVPPTSALTAITGTILLTLQNSSIVDNSTNAYTITNVNGVSTGQTYPFAYGIFQDQGPAGNNWTPSGVSGVTGSTLDYLGDAPTLTSATVANYATLNPLDTNSSPTITNGNLNLASTGATWKTVRSTISLPLAVGKFYMELSVTANSNDCEVGFCLQSQTLAEPFTMATCVAYSFGGGGKYVNGTSSAYGASVAIGDIVGVAYDTDAGTITFYKNNTSQGAITTGWSAGFYSFVYSLYGRGGGTTTGWVNFGQQPFTYTPPSGFVALNTYNL